MVFRNKANINLVEVNPFVLCFAGVYTNLLAQSTLDVYKRQGLYWEVNGYERLWKRLVLEAWAHVAKEEEGLIPVSYTHLDVYKRQGYDDNRMSTQHLI